MATKKIMPFRTPMDERKIVYTNPGKPEEEIIALKINEKGEEEFYIKGKTNLYEKIQMFKDECDIEQILLRCTEQNDLSLLNQRNPLYVDFSEFPDNMIDSYRKIKDAENIFKELPLEVRNEFNNSFSEFLAKFGTKEFMKALGLVKEEPTEEIKTETDQKGEKE